MVKMTATCLLSLSILFAQAPDIKSIHKIFIEKMPNDLDQYLRAEFTKQLQGKVSVVLDEQDADAIMTGISEERKGTADKVTGRYLGLHDIATGTISILSKDRKVLLWSNEAVTAVYSGEP